MRAPSFLWDSEFVGAQQRGDHVTGDDERADRVNELHDHSQILRSPIA
jgi:hypothetical protein